MKALNIATFWVFIGVWLVWLGWEVVLLLNRPEAKTLSMVAKDLGWQCAGLVYLWCGLASHWWWNGKRWAPVWSGALFWLIALGLLVWDFVLWRQGVALHVWFRSPLLWGVVGLLAGRVLFPQRGLA